MIIDEIKEKVGKSRYEYSLHAEIERKADDLTFYQIEEAILTGEMCHPRESGCPEICEKTGFPLPRE